MRKSIASISVMIALMSTSWAKERGAEMAKKLIPTGNDTATWESKCSLSMKGVINVNKDRTFDINVKAYSSVDCEEGTEYISLSRTGKYQYQAPMYATHVGESFSYDYLVSPHQLNLTLSPIKVDSEGVLGSLAKGLLSMYEGCVGVQREENKNENCLNSDISETESRVKLSKMNFITPTKMVGEFRNDINIEFTLVR